jgi:DNA-binding MarR family transcriptional regulator
MHEQNRDNIVEKLTVKRSGEVLNDNVKMAILETLDSHGPLSFGDIIRELEISQPAGTNHILELKLLGLIEKSADPPNYNINYDRYAILLKHRKK